MKQSRKIIVALLLVLTLMMGVVAISASAADEGTTIYFQNNWLWTDVRCYCFDGETVVGEAFPGESMEKLGTDGTYEVYSYTVPAGTTGLIISGIKNDGSGNRDQTPDITSGISNGAGWCMKWDGANAVESFAFNSDSLIPEDPNAIPTYTVAGDNAAVFGTGWDPSNTANDMIYDADKGIYYKEYNNVPAVTLTFKCAQNHNWTVSHGDPTNADMQNFVYTVAEAGSTIKIILDAKTFAITVESHKHEYTVTNTATCTEDGIKTSACSCGKVIEEPSSKTGHNYVDGICTNCNEAEPAEHVHVYSWEITTPATCTAEGVKTYTCSCSDSYTEPVAMTEHTYVYGKCSGCGAEDPNYVVEYYLVGWINDADCGCKGDKASLRDDFKFVDGKVVVSFLSDSYVFVKTSDNQRWYMAGAYDASATSAILYDTPEANVNDETDGIGEKLFVPGGVEVEFTLTKDGSDLVLSYVAEEPFYTVAGSAGLCGSEWDVEDLANDMYLIEDGTYEIVYLGVAAGTYEFKVVKNNSWENGAWGAPNSDANFTLVVAEDNSIVNINFNPATKTIIAQATAVPEENPGEDETPDDNTPGTDVNPGDDETPGDDTPDEPVEELNFFQKIWKAIVDFFMNLFASFKK